ncbi:mucoidy inhibitor MuiA family protein [Robiginitalea sp. M366]|uniref:DUF4139 domain-containing protein n=1 Tax=Robiginitalea aestuariiviva TaxID=3036903 RepID=UPI00240E0F96|nr:mucoidy inhibitor MuiA family protein [Robiginitalea aestuariiviva]MDG1572881.1 mucoidy inhibitor MuiA family protein [Robiginitalea aestuariiviva]
MKTLFSLLLLLPFWTFAQSRDTLELPSRISGVTLFVNGAEIEREATVTLPAGTTKLLLTGLSHRIDENSIQVKGLLGLSLEATSYQVNYIQPAATRTFKQALGRRLKDLETRMGQVENKIAGLQAEEKVLEDNRNIGGPDGKATLSEIQAMGTYYRERITQIGDRIQAFKQELAHLREDQKELTLQIAQAGGKNREPTGEILLTLLAPQAREARLVVSYLVSDAGWVPSYELRSARMGAPLAMTYRGHVYQQTGVDWTDVPLTLSTARPRRGIARPELRPHFLDFGYARQPKPDSRKSRFVYNPMVRKVSGHIVDASGLPLPGVNVVIPGTSRGTQTDFDGYYSLEVGTARELTISYLGMESQTLPIYASVINTRLEEDAHTLEEVVVTAMGTSAAGVSIRGAASAPREPEPLYIIDGVPVSGYTDGDLDASEIEEITTMDGASATALYGNRAADGVILITTREPEAGAEARTTSFAIAGRRTVPSGPEFTAVPIDRFSLDADYEYQAAPVLDEQVYLTAEISGWENRDLLPGEARVYFEGTFVGNTLLDPHTASRKLKVSLGADPQLQVRRKQERLFKSKNLSGSTRVLDRTYTLELKNNGTQPVRVRLLDRIPISQNKEIRVTDQETGNAAYDKEKGILEWVLELAPRQQDVRQFGFQVRYPRGRSITL